MKTKWLIGVVGVLLVASGGALYVSRSRTTEHTVEPAALPQTADSPIPASTDADTEARVSEILERAWSAAKKHDFTQAYAICDEAIRLYGAVAVDASDTYQTYKDMIEATKEHLACIQRREPEKTFANAEDLKMTLLAALKAAKTEDLSKLLHCGMGIGVPASEYGSDYHPETLAAELTALRQNNGRLIEFKSEGENRILTTGYSDGLVRRFDLAPDETTKEWFVGSILYGSDADVQNTP